MNFKYLIIFVWVLLLIPFVDASECTLKYGSCDVTESALFTLYDWSNSHVSVIGTVDYNWSVCCDSTTTIFSSDGYLNTSGNPCPAGEGGIISMFSAINSHVELYNTSYSNHVCVPIVGWDDFSCHFNTSATCGVSETAVISMYNYTNSHMGNLSVYDNILCCNKSDNTPPTAIVTYSSIVPSSSATILSNITFDVLCTDTGGGSGGCDVVNISVYDAQSGIYFDSCEAKNFDAAGKSSCTIPLLICDYGEYNISVNASDLSENINYAVNYGTFQVKNNEGCACVVSNDCFSSACIGASFCGISTPPDLNFLDIDVNVQISLGDTITQYIKLSNPHSIAETIELNIYGDPVSISYWTYFQDQKYGNRTHKIVRLNPGEEIFVPVNIFGAKSGEYKLIIVGESLSNGLKTRKELPVLVYYETNEGLNSQTPGLGLFGLLMIVLFAMFIGKERL